MKITDIAKDLINLSPRQFEREELAKDYIIKALSDNGVDFAVQDFKVSVPAHKNHYLMADGMSIECLPTSFRSGKIERNCDLISSLDFSYESNGKSNINYNPYSDGISLANFYDAPSLAISRKDVEKIKNAEMIDGFVEIEKKTYYSCNILAGNRKDPKNIIFAHYDCFFEGAIDNASGVSVCLKMILNKIDVLKDNLLVFCGAEELSFDKPDYWGKCFRIFEDINSTILKNARRIFIVDCVGTGEPKLKNDKKTVSLYFARSEYDRDKVCVVTSVEKEPEKFYRVYHSNLDDVGGLSEKYLQITVDKCLSIIE